MVMADRIHIRTGLVDFAVDHAFAVRQQIARRQQARSNRIINIMVDIGDSVADTHAGRFQRRRIVRQHGFEAVVVAIPSLFGYNILLGNVKTMITELENYASNLADRIELEAK